VRNRTECEEIPERWRERKSRNKDSPIVVVERNKQNKEKE
jgi:hypothetical protein